VKEGIKTFGNRLYRCEYVIWGRGSRMGSAIVPLDRAFLISYRVSILTIPL